MLIQLVSSGAFKLAVCFVPCCVSLRQCFGFVFGAFVTRSRVTVFGTPCSSMVTVLVPTSEARYSLDICRRSMLPVLLATASANDFLVVARGGF